MRELFRKLGQTLKSGEDAVLVTVVASSGSTPRGAGARMLITKEGRACGTIGGGAVEYHAQQVAASVLETKNSHTEQFLLHKNQVQDLGMICGGDVKVYFQFVSAQDERTKKVVERIEAIYAAGEISWLVSDITENGDGQIGVYSKKNGGFGLEIPQEVLDCLNTKPTQVEVSGHLYYCEKLVQSGCVYIFGGGHVAQALVPALAAVDFRCIILEDREEFCKPELFPGVQETRMVDNSKLGDYVDIQEEDYVCIMTRGHKDDMTVQAYILGTAANYIGVIGSKRKSAGVFAKLKEMGFTDEDLKRIKTPIGLDIKAETPAEIAVSITAELILHRAKRASM